MPIPSQNDDTLSQILNSFKLQIAERLEYHGDEDPQDWATMPFERNAAYLSTAARAQVDLVSASLDAMDAHSIRLHCLEAATALLKIARVYGDL